VKILITGSGGQVGRALRDAVPAGIDVVPLSHAELDIASEAAVLDCVRRHEPDVILNAAAYTAVDRAETEPDAAHRANAQGPRNLALAARASGARLITLSTDYVFDGTSCVPYTPEARPNPLGAYGESKRAGEEAVREALPDRSVILRTSWVYAATGANFLRTMLRVMEQGTVRVVADQVGTPTSARTVADVIWRMVVRPDITGIHHWTDAGVASWYDFAVAIAEEAVEAGMLPGNPTVVPISTDEYPTRARRPQYSVLDKRSLARALGITPVHWRQRLREVIGEMKRA